ncbi:hypothetical protein PG984_015656 [Apiospora sp. TS-2023a]
MHILTSSAVSGLCLGSAALSAIIDPPLPALQTRAPAFKEAPTAPEPTPTPPATTTTTPDDADPCSPDPFCDPVWPMGSVSVVTDTAAGVCTPVLSIRFFSHVCGRTTWTTSTTVTSTADCGTCAIGTLAPLSHTFYVPHCPLGGGGHHTVVTAVEPSTETDWACAATASA